jgi:hypothetical protein
MKTRVRSVMQVLLYVAAGVMVGIAAVAACGGPMNRADAGNGTDAGGGVCCTGPIEVQQPISVTVDDTTPIDVTVTNAVPLDVTLPSPLPVVVSRPTFKGITTAVFDGGGGWPAMNAACDLSFPGSRVCTDHDLMSTFPAPVPGADAWMVMMPTGSDTSNGLSTSWGGLASCCNANANCSAGAALFTYSGATNGYIVTAAGAFDTATCNITRPAACCGY